MYEALLRTCKTQTLPNQQINRMSKILDMNIKLKLWGRQPRQPTGEVYMIIYSFGLGFMKQTLPNKFAQLSRLGPSQNFFLMTVMGLSSGLSAVEVTFIA